MTRLATEVSDVLVPNAEAALTHVRRLPSGDKSDELATINEMADPRGEVRSSWNAMVVDPPPAVVGAAGIDATFDRRNAITRRDTEPERSSR
jgi:hypothetical protein